MTITKIEVQKKRKDRYSIFIDDAFAFGVSEETLIRFNLYKGQVLSEREIMEIEAGEDIEKAKEKAMNLLAIRPRTRFEIKQRLYPAPTYIIDEVIDFLDRYDYLDDEEFAKLFIKDALNLKEWGRIRIIHELRQKGVDDTILSTLEIPKEEEREAAKNALEKRLRHRDILDIKEKNRTIGFLQRRGFSYPLIKELIETEEERQEKGGL